jgi:hypothetical protein
VWHPCWCCCSHQSLCAVSGRRCILQAPCRGCHFNPWWFDVCCAMNAVIGLLAVHAGARAWRARLLRHVVFGCTCTYMCTHTKPSLSGPCDFFALLRSITLPLPCWTALALLCCDSRCSACQRQCESSVRALTFVLRCMACTAAAHELHSPVPPPLQTNTQQHSCHSKMDNWRHRRCA